MTDAPSMQLGLSHLLAARHGHFRLESGHHSDLWLDLELLCLWPARVAPLARELAARLARLEIEAVCGPLVEGAFVGLMVAAELDLEFSYTERFDHPDRAGLFPVEYRIPDPLRERVRGKRVAIVNDVISAGSAVGGSLADLEACGADTVAIGALLVLGTAAGDLAAAKGVTLTSIGALPHHQWISEECPLCASYVPLSIAGKPV